MATTLTREQARKDLCAEQHPRLSKFQQVSAALRPEAVVAYAAHHYAVDPSRTALAGLLSAVLAEATRTGIDASDALKAYLLDASKGELA